MRYAFVDIIEDSCVPEDEIHVKSNGKVIFVIKNVKKEDKVILIENKMQFTCRNVDKK